jgi:hypothetical protein
VVYGAAAYFSFVHGLLDLGWVYDNYVPLLTGSLLFSTLLSAYLYAASFARGKLLAAHGASGYPHYDFWMGRELNPRLGALDLKEFCELYPGMIGWAVLNLAMAYKQYTRLGYVTNSMLLVNAFELYYIVDALWNEKAILTTMDITTDGFGFMLAFGDLCWVPFTFTVQARFLVDYPQVGGAGGRGRKVGRGVQGGGAGGAGRWGRGVGWGGGRERGRVAAAGSRGGPPGGRQLGWAGRGCGLLGCPAPCRAAPPPRPAALL